VTEHEPAVRRLCVAACTGAPGLLTRMQRTGGFYRLFVMSDPEAGTEVAFAAPGLDEMSFVTELIATMREETATTDDGGPLLVGFHVGMTKVVGEGLGGAGADRALALVRDPAVLSAARAVQLPASAAQLPPGAQLPASAAQLPPGAELPADAAHGPARLAVAVTAGLFAELHAEGLDGTDWQPVPPADAWLKVFE
jgi:hypothetical protein